MPFLLLLFVFVTLTTTNRRSRKGIRQSSFVARHRGAVPADFIHAVNLADHQRAADYEQARLRLGTASSVFAAIVALGWAGFGYDAVYGQAESLLPPGLSRSVLFLVGVGAASWLLDLPFSVFRTFGIEQRFGFNRAKLGDFARDKLKSALLSVDRR